MAMRECGTITRMSLNSNKIESLAGVTWPSYEFKRLRQLELWGNLLTQLPAGLIASLHRDTHLNVGNNALEFVPCGLRRLDYLNCKVVAGNERLQSNWECEAALWEHLETSNKSVQRFDECPVFVLGLKNVRSSRTCE